MKKIITILSLSCFSSCGPATPHNVQSQRELLDSQEIVQGKLGLEVPKYFAQNPDSISIYFSPNGMSLEKQRDFQAQLTKTSTQLDQMYLNILDKQKGEIAFGAYLAEKFGVSGITYPFSCEALEEEVDEETLNECNNKRNILLEKYGQNEIEYNQPNLEGLVTMYDTYAGIKDDKTLAKYIWELDKNDSTINYGNTNDDPVEIKITVKKDGDFFYSYQNGNDDNRIFNVRVNQERGIPVLRFSLKEYPSDKVYDVEIFQALSKIKVLYGKISNNSMIGTIKLVYLPHLASLDSYFEF